MKNLNKELLTWLIYSIGFSLLCKSFTETTLQTLSIGVILGFFADMLNRISSNLIKNNNYESNN